jgi:hypothetical protein
MTTPLVVDRLTGGRDATGKLAIAPRGTPRYFAPAVGVAEQLV